MRKNFCLILILSVALHCNCQLDERVIMIFSNKEHFVSKVKSDSLDEPEKLVLAEGPISGLAVYDDDLYVSVYCGQVWRISIYDLPLRNDFWDVTWKKLKVPEEQKIVSMAVIEDWIYLGHKHGNLKRCKVKEPSECEDFYDHNEDILGIGSNPGDGKIYAVSKNGTLLRCCRSTCKEIYELGEDATGGFKVAFNAVWLGVNGNQLWKCSLKEKKSVECNLFYENSYCNAKIISIGATEKYLYVNHDGFKELRRCDPEDSLDCARALKKPDDSLQQFIMGYERYEYTGQKWQEYF